MLRGALVGRPFDFEGRYFHVEGATVNRRPTPPPLYFGGASPAAERRRRPARRRLPRVGRAAGDGRAAPRADARAGRRAGPHAALRHPPARRSPATRAADAWAETERFLDAARPGESSPRPRRALAAASRSASSGCASLHGGSRDGARRSRRTCGPASGSCAAAPAPRSSAATRRSPTASRSTTRSASTSSSSPATRTSRRRTGSARACMPILRRRGLLDELAGRATTSRPGPSPTPDQRPLRFRARHLLGKVDPSGRNLRGGCRDGTRSAHWRWPWRSTAPVRTRRPGAGRRRHPTELPRSRAPARRGEAVERAGFTLVTIDDELTPPARRRTSVGRIGAIERAAFLPRSRACSASPRRCRRPTPSRSTSRRRWPRSTTSPRRGAGWSSPAARSGRGSGMGPARTSTDAGGAAPRGGRRASRSSAALWDSWRTTPSSATSSTSRYLDRDRLHYIDFTARRTR